MPGFLGGSSSGSGAGGEVLFPKEFIDPVTKLRVSQPENLIDTDFEYGLQPTKWETVELINNTPSFFSKSGDTTIPNIVAITTNAGTREITVTTALEHGLAVGIPINVTGTKSITADGAYIINSIPNTTTFTYLCKDNQPDTASIEDLYSSIITGEFFQGSQLRVADSEGITTDGESISTLTVLTESPHGFGVNTPFYFLNLNSTISQEFEAANTASKSFDSSNSATAQTFDGSNTLSTFNIDWSNSATVGGTVSTIDSVSTTNNTIKVIHSTETFANQPLGTPLYYNVSTSIGYFATNPRGVVFLKTIDALNTPSGQSTFKVSATPDGDVIAIEASMAGTFQLANQARTFAGNNVNPLTEQTITVIRETPVQFDGSNSGDLGDGNRVATVSNYSGSLVNATVTAGAGLAFYSGAMVRYSTTGSAATGLTNNTTYWIDTLLSGGVDAYSFTLKSTPGASGTTVTSISGGTGVQTFTRIGVSTDKDIVHVRNANFVVGDMVEYAYPTNGRFTSDDNKNFYFVTKAYDSHNFELSSSTFTPMVATGGTITQTVSDGRTYQVHTFSSTGTSQFTVTSLGSKPQVEYLIVAGGGGGGMDMGGGGGAGGVLYGVTTLAATGNFPVVVGAGGTGAPAAGTSGQPGSHVYTITGTNGDNSSFNGLTAIGGGRGGMSVWTQSNARATGGNGGSGGGASGYDTPDGSGAGTGTAGQGFAGGAASGSYWPGGGGGASQVGGKGNFDRAPIGGNGVFNSITGIGYYWGGGGGGSGYSGVGGFGGFGGGGGGAVGATNGGAGLNSGQAGTWGYTNSWANVPGGNAGANTGGGGGGGSHYNSNNKGGNGGSGVVIIRYPITPYEPSPVPMQATGGTVQDITVGTGTEAVTYRTHRFTTTGANTFTVSNVGTLNGGRVDILLVGGGGAAGNYAGGGGGGEVVHILGRVITAGTYSLNVGAGGVGAVSGFQTSFNGQATTGFGETAKGGGGAKSSDDYSNPVDSGAVYTAVANGGGGSSRAGGYFGSLGTTTGTTGVTFRYGGNRGGQTQTGGGSGNQSPNYPGGGGGGAGGSVFGDTGGTTSQNLSGNGGPGVPIAILGPVYWFGGGGGGGVYYNNPNTTAGSGGIGGGGGGGNVNPGAGGGSALNAGQAGSSSSPFNGGNGGANTGGGAGAGRGETGGRGGDGGSGIIVVRYPISIRAGAIGE